jgi:hypothetical protein
MALEISNLLEWGIAIDSNPPVVRSLPEEKVIIWASAPEDSPDIYSTQYATIADYRRILEERQYYAVLFDGAIIQAIVRYKREEICKYSMCYYPCPVRLGELEIGFESVGERVDSVLLEALESLDWLSGCRTQNEFDSSPEAGAGQNSPNRQNMKTPIRFDFDPAAAKTNHPASHLHICDEDCRIPVYAAISFGRFLRFIFRYLYPNIWHECEEMRLWKITESNRSILREEQTDMFLECVQVEEIDRAKR